MPIRAFILIEASAGKGKEILSILQGLEETVQVDRLTGPFDVICLLESNSLDSLGDLIKRRVHEIPGVKRTMTCLRFGK